MGNTAHKQKTTAAKKKAAKKTRTKDIKVVGEQSLDMILTKPAAKKKGGRTDKLVIDTQKKRVARMRARAQEIASLAGEQAIDEEKLRAVCTRRRMEAEIEGAFFKSCLVESADGSPALVTFKDAYGKVAVEHEEALSAVLGDLYPTFVKRKVSASVAADFTLDELKDAFGDKFPLLNKFFKLEEALYFSGSLMETRAALRTNARKANMDTLDKIVEKVQHKPSISLK